jgi:hypothetical protein
MTKELQLGHTVGSYSLVIQLGHTVGSYSWVIQLGHTVQRVTPKGKVLNRWLTVLPDILFRFQLQRTCADTMQAR